MKQNSQTNIPQLIKALQKQGPVIFLESQLPGHPANQKSYIAGLPVYWIKSVDGRVKLSENNKVIKPASNAWEELSAFHARHNDWMFGYLGYDLKNEIEELKSENEPKLHAPDMFFFVPGFLAEVDDQGSVKVLKGTLPSTGKDAKEVINCQLKLTQTIDKNEYLKAIAKAQEDIYEGDYYEINLSHALSFDFEGNSWNLYEQMKEAGPVPFGGYLSFDGFSLCCSSPERFLAKAGSRVWSQPIKGTASREKGDPGQVQRLQNSDKERAENLMIVDLVRNDLSHFARKGSVRVKDLFEVQSFETVHQMVSTVECEVDPGMDSIELVKSCFPMGSMTGAPKIAAMKAIERLENYKRGIYSGAMGYFKPDGDFDLNVIIRSALIKNNRLIYPVGGAITSDSVAEQEWEETLIKAKAITNIIKEEKG